MLIVFDLDDTLIKTTAEITPFKLELLIESLKEEGFLLSHLDLLDLKRLNQGAEGSEVALIEFFEMYPHRKGCIGRAINLFKSQEVLPEDAFCSPNVLELIESLSQDHTLALVTKGKTTFQNKKISSYKLPTSRFSEIIIVEKGSKYDAYSQIMKKVGLFSKDCVVVGDRIEADLIPAKRLGSYTVHVRSGRGSCASQQKDNIIDYQICSLSELSAIIQDIQIKNFLRVL